METQSSEFGLQAMGPILHWLTLVILCIMPVIAGVVLYKLGGLPGDIAKARNHPQAAAISICGWMGIITLVLWPIAMVWAHLAPAGAAASPPGPEVDALRNRLDQITQRIVALERSLTGGTTAGRMPQ